MIRTSDESLSAGSTSKRVLSGYASSSSIVPPAPHLSSASDQSKSTASKPRWDLLFPDEPVSVKIVPQRYQLPNATSWESRIGWISVTNTAGQIVYDPFVTYPKEPGLKKYFCNKRYNVAKEDLLFRNGARDGKEVERNLLILFDGRTVVVHGARGYSESCYFYDDLLGESLVRDTQTLYSHIQNDGQPALSTVARIVLGRGIRQECDDIRRPDQDATTAMELFLLQCPYNREAKRKQYESSGQMHSLPHMSSKRKLKQLARAKSSIQLLRPPLQEIAPTMRKRPDTSHGERQRAHSLDQTLNAAAQFALRLQRRHFADLGTPAAPSVGGARALSRRESRLGNVFGDRRTPIMT